MSLSLVDELRQKQVLKFQLNKFDPAFINNTLAKDSEGIFNLDSKICETSKEMIMNYLIKNYQNYNFELKYNPINCEIMFKKRELKN